MLFRSVMAALAGAQIVAQATQLTPAQIAEFRRGAYEPGTKTGVTIPVVLKQVMPRYTPEGMKEKLQGTVGLEVIVGVDGKVERTRILKSLDAVFGLDQAAVEAAREWRFTPGLLGDKPVSTIVTLELFFKLH